MKIVINGTLHEALPYSFPKKGKSRIQTSMGEAVITGGGKYPEYTYIKINGASHYVKGAVAEGATITVMETSDPRVAPAMPAVVIATAPALSAEMLADLKATMETPVAPVAKPTKKSRRKT